MDVPARELLEIEDVVVLEHGLDVGPVRDDACLVLVVLPDNGVGRGLALQSTLPLKLMAMGSSHKSSLAVL